MVTPANPGFWITTKDGRMEPVIAWVIHTIDEQFDRIQAITPFGIRSTQSLECPSPPYKPKFTKQA